MPAAATLLVAQRGAGLVVFRGQGGLLGGLELCLSPGDHLTLLILGEQHQHERNIGLHDERDLL